VQSLTKQGLCRATIVALVFFVGACVQVGHIQQTQPVRSLSFTGSHKTVAQCVHQRLGGRVLDEFGSRYVIYDSVKGEQQEYGITHYSVTIAQVSTNKGIAELKVVTPKEDTTGGGVNPGGRPTAELPDATVQRFWTPVVDCAAQAKGAS
jgi:hypothetical protein